MSSRIVSPRFETQTGYRGHQRDHGLLEDVGARRDRTAEHLPRRWALSRRRERGEQRGHLSKQGVDRPQQVEATRRQPHSLVAAPDLVHRRHGVPSDHAAAPVERRAAAVAAQDEPVRLQKRVPVRLILQATGDDALRGRRCLRPKHELLGLTVPEHDDRLARLQLVRVAQWERHDRPGEALDGHVEWGSFQVCRELQQREV